MFLIKALDMSVSLETLNLHMLRIVRTTGWCQNCFSAGNNIMNMCAGPEKFKNASKMRDIRFFMVSEIMFITWE